MKKNSVIYFLTVVLVVIFSACGYRNTEGSGAKSADANTEGTSVTYQLVAIEGHTSPDGAFYELDDSTGRWCERPTAADLMAYSKMNDPENPNELPDLTNYFSNEHTRLFNSCRIVIRDLGKSISLTLIYDGEEVYAASVDKARISAEGIYEFREISIWRFDLPVPEGSLDFTDATDYVITYSANPGLSFANEFGEYFLKFRRLPDAGQ